MRDVERIYRDSALLGPITQGDLTPVWTITAEKRDNSAFDLTGATYTGLLYDVESANVITLAGTFTTSSASGGVFTYAPVAADVAVAGRYILEVKITQSSKPLRLRIALPIDPALGTV